MRLLKKCTIGFLFISLFLSGHNMSAQRTYPSSELWKKHVASFREADQKKMPAEDAILFVGSSTFSGWRAMAKSFPDHRIINRGFGGSQLSDLIFFFQDVVLPYSPCQIIVYEGDNDIASGMSPDEYLQDVITFVRLVEIFLPGTPVDFLSTKPSPGRGNWTEDYLKANELVQQYTASKNHLRFIDVAQLMIDSEGNIRADYFLDDKVHLSPEGYEMWRSVIQPYLSDKALKTNKLSD